jgi:hypothetical protein
LLIHNYYSGSQKGGEIAGAAQGTVAGQDMPKQDMFQNISCKIMPMFRALKTCPRLREPNQCAHRTHRG